MFSLYQYKQESPKSKHETNTKKVETRNKHEDLENLHILLDFKYYHTPLRSRLLPIHFEKLMIFHLMQFIVTN